MPTSSGGRAVPRTSWRMAEPRRLGCVVEGHGEVRAVPLLCHRVLRELLAVPGERWGVDRDAVRVPKGKLIDLAPGPTRGKPRRHELDRALVLLRARGVTASVVVLDRDEDCPAALASDVEPQPWPLPTRAVMASREYESWLLWGREAAERARARAPDPEVGPSDAKGALRRLEPDYGPTTDQERLTRTLDLPRVWSRSRSFDKLVRSLAWLTGAPVPGRPEAR